MTRLLKESTRPEAAEKCPTRDEAAERTDAGRVAPISACVSSSTKYYRQTLSLMGATRLASGHFSAASSRVGLIFCSLVHLFLLILMCRHHALYISDGCTNCPCVAVCLPYCMAKWGQWCRHRRQAAHSLFCQNGRLWQFMAIALVGHLRAHKPQPVQRSSITLKWRVWRALG